MSSLKKLANSRKIFNDEIDFPFSLAPMVGLSHVAMRLMVREYLPAGAKTWWPTEMLSSRRLPNQRVGNTPETYRHENETHLVPQILGNERSFIAPSVKLLEDWGAMGIDINMGCPVKKALKHNYGVSLMGDPSYAAQVVAMTVESSKIPVSVKLRAGLEKDSEKLIRFVEGLCDAGASWICLHPRTAEQKRKGNADWKQIKNLRDAINVPVIGNGDIQIVDDVFQMLEQTDCDGVMIGRALSARPWLLWQIGERLGLAAPEGKEGLSAPASLEEEAYEYGKSLLRFTYYLKMYFTEKESLKRLRFYLRVSAVWLNFGHALQKRISKVSTLDEASEQIQDFFQKAGLCFSERTQLRY